MSKNELTVSLIVYGYEDVSELTKRIGLEPTKALNKGEPLMDGAGPIPQSLWEIKFNPKNDDASLEEQISGLLEFVKPHQEAIAEVASNSNGRVITAWAKSAKYTNKWWRW